MYITHGDPWGPMGTHGTHGNPWAHGTHPGTSAQTLWVALGRNILRYIILSIGYCKKYICLLIFICFYNEN